MVTSPTYSSIFVAENTEMIVFIAIQSDIITTNFLKIMLHNHDIIQIQYVLHINKFLHTTMQHILHHSKLNIEMTEKHNFPIKHLLSSVWKYSIMISTLEFHQQMQDYTILNISEFVVTILPMLYDNLQLTENTISNKQKNITEQAA